jgi:hypothetical protein
MNTDLQRWLNEVTAPFPYATAQRLRRELEAHAEETAHSLRAGGHPAPDVATLQALGPAHKVRRQLEQTHFTLAELEWLRQDGPTRRALEEGTSSHGWRRVFVLLACAFVVLLPLLHWWVNGVFSAPPSVLWWAFYAATACAERLMIRNYSRVAAAILWRVLGMLSVPLVLTLYQPFMPDAAPNWMAILGSCFVLWPLRPRAAFALLPKALRKAV